MMAQNSQTLSHPLIDLCCTVYDDGWFCCRWSSMVSEEHKYGCPDLHQLVASAYWKGKRRTIGNFIFVGYKFKFA